MSATGALGGLGQLAHVEFTDGVLGKSEDGVSGVEPESGVSVPVLLLSLRVCEQIKNSEITNFQQQVYIKHLHFINECHVLKYQRFSTCQASPFINNIEDSKLS